MIVGDRDWSLPPPPPPPIQLGGLCRPHPSLFSNCRLVVVTMQPFLIAWCSYGISVWCGQQMAQMRVHQLHPEGGPSPPPPPHQVLLGAGLSSSNWDIVLITLVVPDPATGWPPEDSDWLNIRKGKITLCVFVAGSGPVGMILAQPTLAVSQHRSGLWQKSQL